MFFRFLLPVRYWVLSLMCSVLSASMPEVCTLLFNANLLSASSKCFCPLTICLPCDDDVALTPWVSCWCHFSFFPFLWKIFSQMTHSFFLFFTLGDTASNLGSAVDELMRHQPTLKTDATTAIIKVGHVSFCNNF